jgi:hypothetical protein
MTPASTRIVWITMLAMVDRLGNVHASVPGLAHRARVSVDECREALETLESPDPDSRTKAHDGRRIRAFEGGWELLNHAKYRAIQNEESVRQSKREHMQRKREEWKSNSTVDIPPLHLDLRSGSDPEGELEGVTVVDPQRGRFAPDDLEASEAQLVRCQELKLDPVVELRAFKLHEFNRAYTDWPRRFSKWIEDSKIRRETDAAKAIAASQRPRQGFAAALPPLESNAKHRAFAAHHRLDLDAVMRKMAEDRIVETLGLGRAKETIGERLSLLVRKKKGSTNAPSSA